MYNTSVDKWCEQNKLSTGFIFTPNMSPSNEEEEEGGDDGLLVETMKWLMTSWQQCGSISEECFLARLDVLSTIEHNNGNAAMSYSHNLYNK